MAHYGDGVGQVPVPYYAQNWDRYHANEMSAASQDKADADQIKEVARIKADLLETNSIPSEVDMNLYDKLKRHPGSYDLTEHRGFIVKIDEKYPTYANELRLRLEDEKKADFNDPNELEFYRNLAKAVSEAPPRAGGRRIRRRTKSTKKRSSKRRKRRASRRK